MRKAILETPFEKAGSSEGVRRAWETRRRRKSSYAETAKRFEEQTGQAREREAKEQAKLKELERKLKEKEDSKDWYGAEEARRTLKNYKEEIGPDLSESEKHHITKAKEGTPSLRGLKPKDWPVVSKYGLHIAHRRKKTLGDVVLGAARGLHPAKERKLTDMERASLKDQGYEPPEKVKADFEEIRKWQREKK